MKGIYRLIIALILIAGASADGFAKKPKVYATVEEGCKPYVFRRPNIRSNVIDTINGGDTVRVVKLMYWEKSHWVKIRTANRKRGYVKTKFLQGNYAEEFQAQLLEPTEYECLKKDFVKYYDETLLRIKDTAGGGWAVVSGAVLLAFLFMFLVRKLDRKYKRAWIYYLLYLPALAPVWALNIVSQETRYVHTLMENIMLFVISFVPAYIAINCAWGVRQCGMIDGKETKNANFEIGSVLGFPVWVMMTVNFWNTFIYPLIAWSETFESQGGGLWLYIKGLLLALVIGGVVLGVWLKLIVPFLFKKAGNVSVGIMTLVIWWAMCKIGYNWLDVNYDNFSMFLAFVVSLPFVGAIIWTMLRDLGMNRCNVCHYCYSMLTDVHDRGTSTSSSTSYRNIYDSEITPVHSGAIVSDAQEKVKTYTTVHEFDTAHKCPRCGNEWLIPHSETVGSSSRVVGTRHTETYFE